MEARAFGGAMVSVVIPGRLAEANPESIMRPECWEEWIPDSRYTASGMTETALRQKSNFQNAINAESTVQPSCKKYFT